MKIEISRYNDVWFDNGLITFSNILDELEEEYELSENTLTPLQLNYEFGNENKFTKTLSSQIKGIIPNIIINTEDKTTQQRKQVKKDFVLIQEGKKIGGKVAFKENIYSEEMTKKVIEELFTNLKGDKKKCFLCGRSFKSNYKNLQQASYPFVTKIKSLSGIRSGEDLKLSEYIKEYCPQCYLLGVLVWVDPTLIYRTIPGQKSILILPNLEDLTKLKQVKNSYYNQLNRNNRYSNIRIDIEKEETENTPDKYSTLVSFYENFIRYTDPELNCQNWYIIEIPLSGSVKNPKYFNVFLENNIVKVLTALIRKDEPMLFYRGFIKETYFFNNDAKRGLRNFDHEKVMQEGFCRTLINNDFTGFAHNFLPQQGGHIGLTKHARQILDKLIYEWRIKPMNKLSEDNVKTLQLAGLTIANLSENHVSLFYKLEKAKNPHDFYKAMQEITRRFVIDESKKNVYPGSISNVMDLVIANQDDPNAFEDIKNILLIYASIKGYNKPETKEANNE